MRVRHWIYTMPLRVRSLVRHGRVESELNEEFQDHLDHLIEAHRAKGLPPKEARVAALRAMGGLEQRKEECRDARGVRLVEDAVADVRYALRAVLRDARFTAVVILTLALGVGLNTAVFSMVSAVMLRNLPYPEADRLVSLWEETGGRQPQNVRASGLALGGAATPSRITVAPANLEDYRRSRAFEGLAGFAIAPRNLIGSGSPERLWGESVTANFFRLLGVKPVQGRDFLAEDDRADATLVVILTDESWQRRFGADPTTLGRKILLDGQPCQVVGILPPGFQSLSQLGLAERIEFYVPASYPQDLLANHADHEIGVVGRLKPGVSVGSAQADLDLVSAALAEQFPASNSGVRAVVAGLHDDLVRNVRTSLLILLGAVGLIVVVACVNVANLLLVRATSRQHETSVRFALGASRGRIVRQFLAESLLLSVAGCGAGVLVGTVMMRLLVVAAPADIPRLDATTMDWRVFAASAGVAALSGLAFGLLPAWHASRARPAGSLKAMGRVAGGRSQLRWRSALTVAEVSLSLVLLVAAGLLLKSFATVVGVDLGFRTGNVLAANINLPETRYRTPELRLQFFEQLERRVSGLPGVQAIAFANRMPMRGGWSSGVLLESGGTEVYESDFQAVSPGYFSTLGIRLVRGRLLAEGDRDGQPAIAVVNQAFVRQFFARQDPTGHRLRRSPQAPWITIVGVVNDIRRSGKTGEITPQVYLAAMQTSLYPVRLADFAVRTSGDPRPLVGAIRAAVWALDGDQPLTNIRTLDDIVSTSVAARRFQMLLLAVFAGVAVTLSVVGIFGVLAYAVTQRTAEFGLRMALGAPSRTILTLVLRQAAVLIGAGVVIGLAGAWGLMRYLQSLLFEVQPHDRGRTWLPPACSPSCRSSRPRSRRAAVRAWTRSWRSAGNENSRRYFLSRAFFMAERSVPRSSSASPHSTVSSPSALSNLPYFPIARRSFAPSSHSLAPSGSSTNRWPLGVPPNIPTIARVVALGMFPATFKTTSASSFRVTTSAGRLSGRCFATHFEIGTSTPRSSTGITKTFLNVARRLSCATAGRTREQTTRHASSSFFTNTSRTSWGSRFVQRSRLV
jgi:predicted permease